MQLIRYPRFIITRRHYHGELLQATEEAVAALNDYQKYLRDRKDGMAAGVALGKERYEYFLREVARIPWDADTILLMAKQVRVACKEHVK
jgi:hypothetical protein